MVSNNFVPDKRYVIYTNGVIFLKGIKYSEDYGVELVISVERDDNIPIVNLYSYRKKMMNNVIDTFTSLHIDFNAFRDNFRGLIKIINRLAVPKNPFAEEFLIISWLLQREYEFRRMGSLPFTISDRFTSVWMDVKEKPVDIGELRSLMALHNVDIEELKQALKDKGYNNLDLAASNRYLKVKEQRFIQRVLYDRQRSYRNYPKLDSVYIMSTVSFLFNSGFYLLAEELRRLWKNERIRVPTDLFSELERGCREFVGKDIKLYALSYRNTDGEWILINSEYLDRAQNSLIHEIISLLLTRMGVDYKIAHRYALLGEKIIAGNIATGEKEELMHILNLFSSALRVCLIDGLLFEGELYLAQGVVYKANHGEIVIISVGHSAQVGREVIVYINGNSFRGEIIACNDEEGMDISLIIVKDGEKEFYFPPLSIR